MSEDAPQLQLVHSPSTAVQEWSEPPLPAPITPKRPLERIAGALRRYRWLMVAVFLLSAIAGAVAMRFVKPQYDVTATIWIQSETPMADKDGPIRSEELLN